MTKDLSLKPISENELSWGEDPEYTKYLIDLEKNGEDLMCMPGRFKDYYYPIYPHTQLEIKHERRNNKER